jgi:cell division protein FtsB
MSRAQRRLRIFALVAAVLTLGVFFGLREHSIAQLHAEMSAVRSAQSEVEASIEDLETRLDRRDDLGYIEYLAREKLGLIRPGEEKYFLMTDPARSAVDGD